MVEKIRLWLAGADSPESVVLPSPVTIPTRSTEVLRTIMVGTSKQSAMQTRRKSILARGAGVLTISPR